MNRYVCMFGFTNLFFPQTAGRLPGVSGVAHQGLQGSLSKGGQVPGAVAQNLGPLDEFPCTETNSKVNSFLVYVGEKLITLVRQISLRIRVSILMSHK